MKGHPFSPLGKSAKAPALNMEPIRKVLGDDTPDLEPTKLGRYHLVQALSAKFGPRYTAVAAAQAALSHFDSELKYFSVLRKIRGH